MISNEGVFKISFIIAAGAILLFFVEPKNDLTGNALS
jgi:hypothetical protein